MYAIAILVAYRRGRLRTAWEASEWCCCPNWQRCFFEKPEVGPCSSGLAPNEVRQSKIDNYLGLNQYFRRNALEKWMA